MNRSLEINTSLWQGNFSLESSSISQAMGSTRILNERKKITENILAGVLFFLSAYLILAAVWYQAKHGKKTMKKTNSLCTVAVLALLIRISAVEFLLHGGDISDSLCNAAMISSYVCFCLNRFLPYVILWCRQRALHKKTAQQNFSAKPLKLLSAFILVGIVIFQPALLVLQILFTRYVASPVGCILQNKDKFFSFLQKASPIFFAASAFFQLMLLGLMLYPLKQHLKKQLKKQQAGLRSTIMRLSLCTVICMVSDLVFLLAKLLKPRGTSSLLTGLLSCCDNTINVTAVLMSFYDFKVRFFPMIASCKWNHVDSKRVSLQKNSSRETKPNMCN